jgi:hypothetical protein
MNVLPSGCAVASDGSLLGASQIKWFNDADDDIPLPTAPTATPEIHPFFRPLTCPTEKIAGARRSSRTTRPSAKATDPDNAMVANPGDRKRIRQPAAPSRRIVRKVIESDSEPSDFSDVSVPTDLDGDNNDTTRLDEYSKLQAMADTDHAV